MHLRRFLLLALLALSPSWLRAQSSSGPFVISSASSPCARISTDGQGTVGIAVTGTLSMTLQPEVSIQGKTPTNIQVTPSTSSALQSTITAAGNYTVAVASYNTFLLCVTSYSSGTATIHLTASPVGNGALPALVYSQITTGQNSVSGAYATIYTTQAAGLYRISAHIYPEVVSSTSWVVEVGTQINKESGAAGLESFNIAQQNINSANFSSPVMNFWLANLGAGQAIQAGTFTVSGSNTGGSYTYLITIERLH